MFQKLAKKAVTRKVEQTVDNHWDDILGVIELLVGGVLLLSGLRGEKKKQPQSVSITYNYYDNRGRER